MAIVESPLSARFNQMVNDSAVAQRVVVMLQKLGIPDSVSIAAMSDDQWSAVLAFLLVKPPGRVEDLDDPGRLGPGHRGALGRLRRVACEEHPEVAPAPPLAAVASTREGAAAAAAYSSAATAAPEPTEDLLQLLQIAEEEANIAMQNACL